MMDLCVNRRRKVTIGHYCIVADQIRQIGKGRQKRRGL